MRNAFAFVAVLALGLAPVPSFAQIFEPTFFGGAGDQRGTSIAISNGALYVAGQGSSGAQGVVVRYALPLGTPVWSQLAPASATSFLGVAVQDTYVFAAGTANPPSCGASDGVGGTEAKVGLTRMQTDGTGAACQSANFFGYRGTEVFAAASAQTETGTPYFYLIGSAENCGSGHTLHVLAKYTTNGTLANWVTEQPSPGCIGGSYGNGITAHGGFLYVAAHTALFGAGEDNVARPALMKYDPSLTRMWKYRSPGIVGVNLAVAAVDGSLYTAGYAFTTGVPNSEDYLVQKFDQDGNLLWSQSSGGAATDVLTGIVGLRGRVFAVGYTRSEGSGGADAVLLEIDPATGNTRSTALFGGALEDLANGVVTDGTDLYAVAESRSFATPEGNSVGENDLVVLRVIVGDHFYTVPPCRAVDTRNAPGPLGGPALAAGDMRTFPISGTCGIPTTARAISVNLAVTGSPVAGNLRLYPAGTISPLVSAINYSAGQTRSNNAVVSLSAAGEVDVLCSQATGTVHFILDVNGWFE